MMILMTLQFIQNNFQIYQNALSFDLMMMTLIPSRVKSGVLTLIYIQMQSASRNWIIQMTLLRSFRGNFRFV